MVAPISNFPKIRTEMAAHGYYNFKLGQDGGVDSATLDAANLWGALKDKVPLPRKRLSLSVDSASIDKISSCDVGTFKSLDTLLFFSPPQEESAPTHEPTPIPDTLIKWLEGISVNTIAFNQRGFKPQDIIKLEKNPTIAEKLHIYVGSADRAPPDRGSRSCHPN